MNFPGLYKKSITGNHSLLHELHLWWLAPKYHWVAEAHTEPESRLALPRVLTSQTTWYVLCIAFWKKDLWHLSCYLRKSRAWLLALLFIWSPAVLGRGWGSVMGVRQCQSEKLFYNFRLYCDKQKKYLQNKRLSHWWKLIKCM